MSCRAESEATNESSRSRRMSNHYRRRLNLSKRLAYLRNRQTPDPQFPAEKEEQQEKIKNQEKEIKEDKEST